MGREIRRVARDWQHPQQWQRRVGEFGIWAEYVFIPLYDYSDFLAWLKGWEESGKFGAEPRWSRKTHMPDFGDAGTWFQFYENITEGTPLSPPLETLGEVREWLVSMCGYPLAAANAFIERGYAPSFVYSKAKGMVSGVEYLGRVGNDNTN